MLKTQALNKACGEWQCSEECRKKHRETMDNI